MDLNWNKMYDDDRDTTWVAEVDGGKYRFVISEQKTELSADKPFYGRLQHVVDGKPYLLESGHYKTFNSATTALKRMSGKYSIGRRGQGRP